MKINHYNSQSMDWSNSARQLIKYQKKIYTSNFNFRQIRNLQRFLVKSVLIRLLLIHYILKNSYTKTNRHMKILGQNQFVYFNFIEELNVKMDIYSLSSSSYCFYLKQKIYTILWVLAIIPIQERFANRHYLQTRLAPQNKYLVQIIHQTLVHDSVNYIHFIYIPFDLSAHLKYWLVKYTPLETKYLLYWFQDIQNVSHRNAIDQIHLVNQSNLSLFVFFKAFYICCFIYFYKFKKNRKPMIHWFHFNHLIYFNENFNRYFITTSPLIHKYDLTEGFNLFGWYLKKQNLYINQSISLGNIKYHQTELVKFLQNAGTYPIDKVINMLNYKINIWKIYYLKKIANTYIVNQLNTYLFWRVWYFLKKRHKNRGMKWIIYHYFKKDTYTKKWIFSNNQVDLLTYNS